MIRQFSSGRDNRSRALVETPLPIPLDAASMPGASVLGEDGRVYRSERFPGDSGPWTWVSIAEIAEALSADLIRVAALSLHLEVDSRLPDVEGARYSSINKALAFISGYQTTYRDNWEDVGFLQHSITILSGDTIKEQLLIDSLNMRNITINAEDGVVTVEPTALGTLTDSVEGLHAWMTVRQSGAAPILRCRLLLGAGSVPQDAAAIAAGNVSGSYTPRPVGIFSSGVATIGAQSVDPRDGTAVSPIVCGGFEGAWYYGVIDGVGAQTILSNARIEATTANNGRGYFCRGAASIARSVIRHPSGSLQVSGSCTISQVGVGAGQMVDNGDFGQDFRIDPAVDSANDIRVLSGGFLRAVSGMRGGVNIPDNTFNVDGTVARSGQPNRTYTRDNIVGTVSQAAGVPTGAVVERGSGGNGHFVRLADGTQVCWVTLNLSASGATTWTFPAVFVEAPHVTGMAGFSTEAAAIVRDTSPTTTTVAVSARRGSDNARLGISATLAAFGRWF